MSAPRQIQGLESQIPGFYFNNCQYQIKDGMLCDITNNKIMYQSGRVLCFAIIQLPTTATVYFVLNVRHTYTDVQLLIFNDNFQLLQSLRSHTVDFIHCAGQLITCDRVSIDFYKHTADGFKFTGSKIHSGLNLYIVYRGYYVGYDSCFIIVYDKNFKPYKNILHAGIMQYMAESPDGNLIVQFKDYQIVINPEFQICD